MPMTFSPILAYSCISVSFFIISSILVLNSGLLIRLFAMFWKAGFWNIEFMASILKPGGMPGQAQSENSRMGDRRTPHSMNLPGMPGGIPPPPAGGAEP
jgi:hypothetical protein